MSVVYQGEDVWTDWKTAKCFLCGREFEGVAILWAGHETTIHLHPPCVISLMRRLNQDLETFYPCKP